MLKSLSVAGILLGANLTLAQAATMATGEGHSAVIRGDKSLWTWGNNDYGQTGQANVPSPVAPAQIGAGQYLDIACGAHHTAAVDSNSNVWVWGHNGFGELGLAHTNPVLSPTQLTFSTNLLEKTVAVVAGDYSTYILKMSGQLFAFGRNNVGQLGLGTTSNFENAPMLMTFAQKISKVASGPDFALAISEEGTLWAWGSNGFGQLGLGDQNNRNAPVLIGTDSDWVEVTCGGSHVLALKNNGDLYAWGNDRFGQTGLGSQSSPVMLMSGVKFISAGREHSLLLKNGMEVWSKGRSQVGQLGRGLSNNGDGMLGQVGSNDWFTAVTGRYHNLALKTDGQLYAWGQNAQGQSATGQQMNAIPQPVSISVDPFPMVEVTSVTSLTSGENITLNSSAVGGTGSLTTNWSLISGPTGGDSSVVNNGNTAQCLPGIPGTYTIMVVVNDGTHNSTQTVTIHVKPAVFGQMKWGENSWNAGEITAEIYP